MYRRCRLGQTVTNYLNLSQSTDESRYGARYEVSYLGVSHRIIFSLISNLYRPSYEWNVYTTEIFKS